jgi:hypothetical protein
VLDLIIKLTHGLLLQVLVNQCVCGGVSSLPSDQECSKDNLI